MFTFIKDFVTEEIDDFSNLLITVINSVGEPEQPKRFDRNTNHNNTGWIQDGHFKITKLNDSFKDTVTIFKFLLISNFFSNRSLGLIFTFSGSL